MKREIINGIRRYTMQHPAKSTEIQICRDLNGWSWRHAGGNGSGKWCDGVCTTKKVALEEAVE